MTTASSHPAPQSRIDTFSALGLIFITLKLLGQIDWSWWWILAPFWMPITLVLSLKVVGGLIKACLE